MSTPNPQSPTPDHSLYGPRTTAYIVQAGGNPHYADETVGADFASQLESELTAIKSPTPAPTLQAAAAGVARELIPDGWCDDEDDTLEERDRTRTNILRHFSFVEELVRERDQWKKGAWDTLREAEKHLSAARAERDQWQQTTIKDRDENVNLRDELTEARAERDAAVKERDDARYHLGDHTRQLLVEVEAHAAARQEAAELRERLGPALVSADCEIVRLREQLAAADEMAKDFKRCAKERKQLIEGVVYAENEVTEFRNKHFDEDPGDDGQRGSPEYETLRGLEHHLSGTTIDDDGEFMPCDKYAAALLAYQAARQ